MIAIDITVRDDIRQFSETVFLKVPAGIDTSLAGARALEFVTDQIEKARNLPLPLNVEIIE